MPRTVLPNETGLPKVLHVLAPGRFGGLERVVGMLAQEWAARGANVGLALAVEIGHRVPDEWSSLETAGVQVIRLPVGHRAYGREWRLYRDTMRRWKPDIVHCHGYRPDVLAGWAARALGLPRVATVHGFTGGDWKNHLYERLQIRALARFDGVIAVSRPIRERLLAAGVPERRIRFVPNALSTIAYEPRSAARRKLGIPDDALVLGWVGRISAEKGLDVLLAALPGLKDLPVTVSVVGDGPLRGSLQQEAMRLGVNNRLRWHGPVEGAARLCAAYDCFVLSSRTEGTPITLLEAMAAGVPIVTAAVGGVPDVLGADEGVLVPAEDPGALAAAIRATLDDRPAALLKADRARSRLSRDFSAASWVEQHRSLYQDVLAGRLAQTA
jgi:glycosyltransferase involved in cell wall biosynthesis